MTIDLLQIVGVTRMILTTAVRTGFWETLTFGMPYPVSRVHADFSQNNTHMIPIALKNP